MFCKECGAQLPDNSAFCTKCGTPIAQSQQPNEETSVIPQQAAPITPPPVYQSEPILPLPAEEAPDKKSNTVVKYIIIVLLLVILATGIGVVVGLSLRDNDTASSDDDEDRPSISTEAPTEVTTTRRETTTTKPTMERVTTTRRTTTDTTTTTTTTTTTSGTTASGTDTSSSATTTTQPFDIAVTGAPTAAELVGTWSTPMDSSMTGMEALIDARFTFNADGTGSMDAYYEGVLVVSQSITYTYDVTTQILNLLSSSMEEAPVYIVGNATQFMAYDWSVQGGIDTTDGMLFTRIS